MKEITLSSSVKKVKNNAFDGVPLTDVNFVGTEEQWNEIIFVSYNNPIENATRHYFTLEDGKIGENAFYTLNTKTGEVVITGTGATYDYLTDSPFYSSETVKSLTVGEGITAVGVRSFYRCKNLENVNFPSTLESIGAMAFNECFALKNVKIPDSVTKIESGAFLDCTAVKSIVIGKGLKTLKEDSFKGTTALETITVSEENQSFTALNNVLFNKEKTTLYLYAPKKADTEYAIPETVKRIVAYSFLNAKNILEVTVPEGVTKIENYTFSNCTALKRAVIPSTVTIFATGAFYGSSLNEVFFSGCAELWKKIDFGSSNDLITNASYHFTGHNFSDVTTKKAPTCLEAGNYAYKKCSLCGLYYASDAGNSSSDGKESASDFAIVRLEHSYTGEIKSDGNGKYDTHSHKCVNGCEKYGNAEAHEWDGGVCTVCSETIAKGVDISGTVKSFKAGSAATGDEVTTIELIKDGKTVCTLTVSGTGKQSYVLDCVADGNYTLRVSKLNHVTREYEIEVDGREISMDLEICLLGDVDASGSVNVTDYVRILQAAKGMTTLEGYRFDCANVDGMGRITVTDYVKVLRHAKGIEYLW